LIVVVSLGYAVFFYVTVYQAFNAVSPRNRDMEPGMIFLMLIPFFNMIWYFFVVIRMASSMEKEFSDRGLRKDGDFGLMLGILAAVVPCFGLIMAIMWLMKIRGYTEMIRRSGSSRLGGGFDAGFEDGLRG
jgi:hypothetical protein